MTAAWTMASRPRSRFTARCVSCRSRASPGINGDISRTVSVPASLTAAISASSSPGGRCPARARTVIARSHSSAISRWDLASRRFPGGSWRPKTASACDWHNALTVWRRPGSFSPHTAGRPHIQQAPPGDGTRSTPPPATGGSFPCPNCQDDCRHRGCRHSVNHDSRAAAPTRRCPRPQRHHHGWTQRTAGTGTGGAPEKPRDIGAGYSRPPLPARPAARSHANVTTHGPARCSSRQFRIPAASRPERQAGRCPAGALDAARRTRGARTIPRTAP